jgi:hypothetical protein
MASLLIVKLLFLLHNVRMAQDSAALSGENRLSWAFLRLKKFETSGPSDQKIAGTYISVEILSRR